MTNREVLKPDSSPEKALAQNNKLTHPVTLSPCHLVLLWSLAFIALHIVTTLQIWDRYLLPLAPMLALGIGWAGRDWRPESRDFVQSSVPSPQSPVSNLQSLVSSLFLFALLFPALTAATGHLPIGGDHGAYNGFDEALTELKSEIGAEQLRNSQFILYHQSLGWHYQFYLYDAVRTGETDLRWFPSTVYLADNATKAPHLRKFLILPSWLPMPDLEFHLHSRGLQLKRLGQEDNFTLVEILQPPQPVCNWCFSALRHPFPTLTDIPTPAMICQP